MAKTGIKFKKCNVKSAEVHNTRNREYLAAVERSPKKYYDIFHDKTKDNLSWRNPAYSDKTLPEILNEIRTLVKDKTGRSMQEADRIKKYKDPKTNEVREKVIAGSSPIREGCPPILPTTKIEDFKPVVEWLEQRGVHTIGIYLHFDEGHVDAVTKERVYNNHAHFIVDWMEHETGKSIKLNDRDMSELQTVLAEALGMERGELKELTSKEGLSAKEYREQKAGESVAKLEAQKEKLESENEELKTDNASLQEENRQILIEACQSLQTTGKNNVVQFDRLVKEANGSVLPTAQEKETRDQLVKEVVRDIKSLTAHELRMENATLHKLIDATFKAINRIGTKLRELAANVPKFTLLPGRKGKMLAHEAELEAKVSNAQADAKKAAKSAENALNEANLMIAQATAREKAAKKREEAAAERERQAQEAKTAAEKVTAEQLNAARKEGALAKHMEWEKWYDNNFPQLKAQRDKLKKDNTELQQQLTKVTQERDDAQTDHLQQAIDTAKKLIRTFGATVFEDNQNCDFTEYGSWQTAKMEIAQEQKQNNGVKFRG